MTQTAAEKQRLFVGGLYNGVSADNIKNRFSNFGEVTDVDIRVKPSRIGDSPKTFAYVNIYISESKLDKCKRLFNGTRWKGQTLSIQLAKPDFLKRLQQEREEITAAKSCVEDEETSEDEQDQHKALREIKGGKPGTEVEGKQDWVVGKFGRVLPVMTMRRRDQKKVVSMDPSVYCHTVKSLDKGLKAGDSSESRPFSTVDALTWQLDDSTSTEIKRKIQGKFPEYHPPKRTSCTSMATWQQEFARARRKEDELLTDFEVVKTSNLLPDKHQNSGHDGYNSGDDSAGSADTDEILSSLSAKRRGHGLSEAESRIDEGNTFISTNSSEVQPPASDKNPQPKKYKKMKNGSKHSDSTHESHIASVQLLEGKAASIHSTTEKSGKTAHCNDIGSVADDRDSSTSTVENRQISGIPSQTVSQRRVSGKLSHLCLSEYGSGFDGLVTDNPVAERSGLNNQFWLQSTNDEDLDVFDIINSGQMHKLYKNKSVRQPVRAALAQQQDTQKKIEGREGVKRRGSENPINSMKPMKQIKKATMNKTIYT